MSYIGSSPASQAFAPGTDTFSGTGSQVAFTLSRNVATVNDILVVVNNVDQQPTAYTVASNILTFSAAPSSGTNNIYVRYLSTNLITIAPQQGSVGIAALSASGTPSSTTFLRGDNVWVAPSAAALSGTLAVANGGTGLTSTPSNGALDIGNGTGFTRTTLTAGSNITITNGAGTITIAAAGGGLGVGQTMTNVTASRALGTTYTNSTGKPIFVYANFAGTNQISWQINGVAFGTNGDGGGYNTIMGFIVQDGSTYRGVTASGSPSLQQWWELR